MVLKIEVEGVWLSDVPFDRGFDPPDAVTLAVTLADDDLVDREVITASITVMPAVAMARTPLATRAMRLPWTSTSPE